MFFVFLFFVFCFLFFVFLFFCFFADQRPHPKRLEFQTNATPAGIQLRGLLQLLQQSYLREQAIEKEAAATTSHAARPSPGSDDDGEELWALLKESEEHRQDQVPNAITPLLSRLGSRRRFKQINIVMFTTRLRSRSNLDTQQLNTAQISTSPQAQTLRKALDECRVQSEMLEISADEIVDLKDRISQLEHECDALKKANKSGPLSRDVSMTAVPLPLTLTLTLTLALVFPTQGLSLSSGVL